MEFGHHPRTLACVIFAATIACVAQSSWAQELKVILPKDGYLFVDGEYVEPPYRIEFAEDRIVINDQEYTEEYFAIADPASANRPAFQGREGRRSAEPFNGRIQGRGWRPDGPRGNGPRGNRGPSPLARTSHSLEQVQIGAIVVMARNTSPIEMYASDGYQLLSKLAGRSDGDLFNETTAARDKNTAAALDRLIAQFEPSDAFRSRVAAEIETVQAAELSSNQTMHANELVAQISYPLTVFAMVLVVLGFGHLLSTRPVLDSESSDPVSNRKIILKSLWIIALLSIVDLIWTLAASHAGTMRELNPLGSRLIADPASLVLFKVMVTSTSISILYALHRKPVAHTAAWWCCLLLTLLTARWVVFQSMFA